MLIPAVIVTRRNMVDCHCKPLFNCNIYADRIECNPDALETVLEGLKQACPDQCFEVYSQEEWEEKMERLG
jgi:hypothetical protein